MIINQTPGDCNRSRQTHDKHDKHRGRFSVSGRRERETEKCPAGGAKKLCVGRQAATFGACAAPNPAERVSPLHPDSANSPAADNRQFPPVCTGPRGMCCGKMRKKAPPGNVAARETPLRVSRKNHTTTNTGDGSLCRTAGNGKRRNAPAGGAKKLCVGHPAVAFGACAAPNPAERVSPLHPDSANSPAADNRQFPPVCTGPRGMCCGKMRKKAPPAMWQPGRRRCGCPVKITQP